MDCSTIIVSYNTFAMTREAVRSALTSASGLDHEVIVVDNVSPDRSAELLREAFPEAQYPNVHVIANRENTGFSGGNNQGAALAQGRYLLFLNPDTLSHDGAIAALYQFAEAHPEAGAIGPQVLNADGTLQTSVYDFPSLAASLRHHLLLDVRPRRASAPRRLLAAPHSAVDVVKGCAVFMPRAAFDAIGGWDERYFMYGEENQLCLDLHRCGYAVLFYRDAVITHYGAESTKSAHASFQIKAMAGGRTFAQAICSESFLRTDRALGVLGYGLRAGVLSATGLLRPQWSAAQRGRLEASRALFRWYLRGCPTPD